MADNDFPKTEGQWKQDDLTLLERKERNPQQFSMSTGCSSKGEFFSVLEESDPFLRNSYWISSPLNDFIGGWYSCAWGLPTALISAFIQQNIGFGHFLRLLHHVWDCLDFTFKTWREGKQFLLWEIPFGFLMLWIILLGKTYQEESESCWWSCLLWVLYA